MNSELRNELPGKPHIYFDGTWGAWRVTRKPRGRFPQKLWKVADEKALGWNAYRGPENREARLATPWAKQLDADRAHN